MTLSHPLDDDVIPPSAEPKGGAPLASYLAKTRRNDITPPVVYSDATIASVEADLFDVTSADTGVRVVTDEVKSEYDDARAAWRASLKPDEHPSPFCPCR